MVSIASCVRRSWPASAEELPALPAGGLAVRLAGAACRRLSTKPVISRKVPHDGIRVRASNGFTGRHFTTGK